MKTLQTDGRTDRLTVNNQVCKYIIKRDKNQQKKINKAQNYTFYKLTGAVTVFEGENYILKSSEIGQVLF